MTYASTLLALSPHRFFRFADASGIAAADGSSNASAGVYAPNSAGAWTGGTLGVSGPNAGTNAAYFSDSGHITGVGGAFPADGATNFSISGWVYPNTGGGFRTMFARFDSTAARVEMSLGGTGSYGLDLGLVVSIGDKSASSDAAVFAIGVWSHVAIVFDGTLTGAARLKMYIDGASVPFTASGAFPAAAPTLTANAQIGARNTTIPWSGRLGDFALHNNSLSAANVSSLYAARDIGGGGGGGAEVLTASSVPSAGNAVNLTFDISATPAPANLTVLVDGVPYSVSALTGAGTAWVAVLGNRWVSAGQIVSVKYSATTLAATNASTITRDQIKFVGRKLGLFLHFGIETFLDLEWSLGTESPNLFAPSGNIGSAIDNWIGAAVGAGASYAVLTTKHHGGFCLWPTASTPHCVSSSSPWYASNGSPDIVRLFAAKCRAAGLGVGLYWSGWDRNFESRTPGFTGAQYETHLKLQLTELLTQYGAVDLIWIDGYGWASGGLSFATVPRANISNHIKGLQPRCQVLINTHEGTLANSDIVVLEKPVDGLPGAGTVLPSECAETIRADSLWFFKTSASSDRALATLQSDQTTCNTRRSAYLLNIPPDRTGSLPVASAQRFVDMSSGALTAARGTGATGAFSAARTVTVTLTSDGTTPRASLTGLKWRFYDSPSPTVTDAPTASGRVATTNASGVMVLNVTGTALAAAGVGWLEVSDSDGTVGQSPVAKIFGAPVTVA